MSFLTAYHRQKATLWKRSGIDSFGQPAFDSPTVIDVRWEERNERIINPEGVEKLSRSRVFTSTEISIGDYLKQGVSAESDPRSLPDAWEVLDSRVIPGLWAEDSERKVFL